MIRNEVETMIKKYRKEIELFQWAVMNGVAALVYTEYISMMQHRQVPVHRIMIPDLSNLERLLNDIIIPPLRDKLVNSVIHYDYYGIYKDRISELVIFNEENRDTLNILLDEYILNNVIEQFPKVIRKKFSLDDPNNQIVIQDREIEASHEITEDHINFMIKQIILHYFITIPSIEHYIARTPGSNNEINMHVDELLVINNNMALSSIILTSDYLHYMVTDPDHIMNAELLNTIKFVTSTSVKRYNGNEWNDRKKPFYTISTAPFNQVSLVICK